MTDKEINEAMAKACGTLREVETLEDWDAVHEAVGNLTNAEKPLFWLQLAKVAKGKGGLRMIDASQRDWCEAYLRTKGLWKEEK